MIYPRSDLWARTVGLAKLAGVTFERANRVHRYGAQGRSFSEWFVYLPTGSAFSASSMYLGAKKALEMLQETAK